MRVFGNAVDGETRASETCWLGRSAAKKVFLVVVVAAELVAVAVRGGRCALDAYGAREGGSVDTVCLEG